MKIQYNLLSGIIAVGLLGGLVSCTPGQQQGAQYGAMAGAALGAISGDDTGDIITKAGVGAAIGAGVVAVREGQFQQPSSTTQQNTYPTQQTVNYPYAKSTGAAGYVKSPYSPYNTLDVRGIASGTKVTEPGTNNIFIIP